MNMHMQRPLSHSRSPVILVLSLVAAVLLVKQADLDGIQMWVVFGLGVVVYIACAVEWTLRSRPRPAVKVSPLVLPALTGPDVPTDWVHVRCENCLRSGWVPPATGAAINGDDVDVHLLCTDCAKAKQAMSDGTGT